MPLPFASHTASNQPPAAPGVRPLNYYCRLSGRHREPEATPPADIKQHTCQSHIKNYFVYFQNLKKMASGKTEKVFKNPTLDVTRSDRLRKRQPNTTRKESLSISQPPIFEPMRIDGFIPQPLPSITLVVGVVALEPLCTAIALEGEDVGSDAIEEPAVM